MHYYFISNDKDDNTRIISSMSEDFENTIKYIQDCLDFTCPRFNHRVVLRLQATHLSEQQVFNPQNKQIQIIPIDTYITERILKQNFKNHPLSFIKELAEIKPQLHQLIKSFEQKESTYFLIPANSWFYQTSIIKIKQGKSEATKMLLKLMSSLCICNTLDLNSAFCCLSPDDANKTSFPHISPKDFFNQIVTNMGIAQNKIEYLKSQCPELIQTFELD